MPALPGLGQPRVERAISDIVGLFYLAQLWHIYPVLDHSAVSCCATVSLGWQPEEDFCRLPPAEGKLVEHFHHIAVRVAGRIAGHLAAVEDTGRVVPKKGSISPFLPMTLCHSIFRGNQRCHILHVGSACERNPIAWMRRP